MRLSFVHPIVFCSALFTAPVAEAGLTENFNSRKGVPISNIRTSLQNSCWTFMHFDVNGNGWNPKIEGDGAMVSAITALQKSNAGIYTPLLNIGSQIDVSFEYTFNEDFDRSSTRWIKLCLANSSNEIITELEKIDLTGFQATKSKKFSTQFSNLEPGEYRLVLLYGGSGGHASIAIDDLKTSAPFKYEGGCNAAPVALRDNIKGLADRTASGSLVDNDKEKNNEPLSAYLIKNSPDGKVTLKEDGTFSFAPHKNFQGSHTSFTYKICDNGNLCSPNATVNIHFPTGQLVDFKGSYQRDGNVELEWNTSSGTDISRFELERSINGREWENSGTVFAGNASRQNDYTYIDKVGKNIALKKDLYYRLKQVKSDGTSATSRLLIVRVYNTKAVSMISVTPNPSKSDIAVNVQLQESALVAMRIIDASGSTVLHKTSDVARGTSNILIEGSSKITPGLYTLEVIVNSKERMLVKLIKE